MKQAGVWQRYENIFWDFDGVILDSMTVRDKGFELVLKDYPREQVEALLDYHRRNGGLSRYVKFRYFFETIRGEALTEKRLGVLAAAFSDIMLKTLGNKDLLIPDTRRFLPTAAQRFRMHVVSGSDQNELRKLCAILEIDHYFKSIHGSPKPKKEWVGELLAAHNYDGDKTVLIGDSINDLEAARDNEIGFIGYNNSALRETADYYFDHFEPL